MATAVASIEDLRLYFEAKCAKVLQIIELKGIGKNFYFVGSFHKLPSTYLFRVLSLFFVHDIQ